MNGSLKIYLADDHNLVAKAIAGMIQQINTAHHVKVFSNGKDLFDACCSDTPHLIFLDLEMPVWDGRETLKALKEKFPLLRCIVLSMNNEKEIIDHCIELDANGYLNKDCTEAELQEAITYTGDVYFSKEVLKTLAAYNNNLHQNHTPVHEPLTDREIEILGLLCEGLSPKEIADKIYLSPRTVETHKKNIMAKFEVGSVGKLISVALKNKVIK